MTGGLASLSINYSGVISVLLTCAQVWQVTFVCSLPYCQRGQQSPISLCVPLSFKVTSAFEVPAICSVQLCTLQGRRTSCSQNAFCS